MNRYVDVNFSKRKSRKSSNYDFSIIRDADIYLPPQVRRGELTGVVADMANIFFRFFRAILHQILRFFADLVQRNTWSIFVTMHPLSLSSAVVSSLKLLWEMEKECFSGYPYQNSWFWLWSKFNMAASEPIIQLIGWASKLIVFVLIWIIRWQPQQPAAHSST